MDDLKQTILFKLEDIFKTRFNINPGSVCNDYLNENLCGKSFHMHARDLLYLFFEIEREFNIQIPQNYILSGDFLTFGGIVDMISHCTSNRKSIV